MRPVSVPLLFLFFFTGSCAHGQPGGAQPAASPASPAVQSARTSPPVRNEAAKARLDDADGDGVPDLQDGCPLDPGEAYGTPCPTRWGYFFLRVIDGRRLPVKAALAFQPAVNKMVAADDGYSGVLRAGTYELHVEAPGFAPADVTFEVFAEEKALVEVELLPSSGEKP